MFKVQFEPQAYVEAEDAFYYYEGKQIGLGERFLKELRLCISRISKEPLHFQFKKDNRFREALLSKFPYVIIYEFTGEIVVVYSVFNSYRNPKRKP